MTQQEIESIGFEYMENQLRRGAGKEYLKSLERLWIHLYEIPFITHTIYEIQASYTEDGLRTTVVHSIRLSTLDELKTLLKQLNLHE